MANLNEFTADICIIGAGVAGAALACSLKKSNHRICVIEKDWSEQDRIVGELLQPDGVEQLFAMNLEPVLDGFDAQIISGYTIIKNNEHLHIDYPHLKYGRGLTNGKFLQCMRSQIQGVENIECIKAEAKEFIYDNNGSICGVFCSDGYGELQSVHAKITIVTDGFFSKFRKITSENTAEVTGFFLGMVLKDCDLPFESHGHVFLTDSSPFLCYPIKSNEVRLLIDFPGNQPPKKGDALKDYLIAHVRSRLPQKMHHAFDLSLAEGKFKVMPNHYLPGKAKQIDGVLVLGDALNMRHPLTGGGMTVSLRDVRTCSELLSSGEYTSLEERNEITKAFYNSREQHATVNILADALYNVMSNNDLKNACFEYLTEGGKQAQEPIALLSGIEKRKVVLAKHFFAVAIKGAWKKMKVDFNLNTFKNAYFMIGDAFYIIYPLLGNEIKSKPFLFALEIGKKLFLHQREDKVATRRILITN